MADIEKVTKALECCSSCMHCLSGCPYDDDDDDIYKCTSALAKDALALLKEQQPKKGHWQPYKYGDDTWHQCSACGVADRYIDIVKRDGYPDYRMVSKRNFCPNCGADMRKNDTH